MACTPFMHAYALKHDFELHALYIMCVLGMCLSAVHVVHACNPTDGLSSGNQLEGWCG